MKLTHYAEITPVHMDNEIAKGVTGRVALSYRTPFLTVDIIIDFNENIVLMKQRNHRRAAI